jgi:hypothetical protein
MDRRFAYLVAMSMRLSLCFAAIAALSLAGSPNVLAGHAAPPAAHPNIPPVPTAPTTQAVVVELFTSQGCSDCPPADALLGELAKRKGVIALTLPVTYWDMLGWKDTFASEANTVRQKAYAKALGRSGVYTPQIIVNGVADIVGGRRDQVIAAIAAHEHDSPAIPITVKTSPQLVQIAVAAGRTEAKDPDCTIWVMHTLNHADVHVGEGENKGRALAYTNIVRDLKAIGLWKGDAVTFTLPRGALTSVPHDGFVVLLQRDDHGQVIGAAMVTAPNYSGKH